ncbi:YhgE/Pip domain-containing protein [Actinomadura rupiterrae]|uniref:YhgE/Pip domain-containing protein n=1 Tax=Actinomadura rupiterrae TaxID=559627 RepID=UPI0020A42596|nr:YhgE/Pip domain-containing protein [Actinomadura rupiterrae]MCP2335106.1 putative membrane protein [Actinomadura rupiterrae]
MRLPSLTTGALELRRFRRHPLTMVALVGMVLLPLLYAGLYLWSFWDPYGRLHNVPVALVVDDKPAQAGGKKIDAGHDLADQLKKRQVFDWKTVDEATAEKGVRDGKYYMSLTIPADFSARIAGAGGKSLPTPADLKVRINDSNNYVVGTLAQAAFKEIGAAAGDSASKGYFDQVFVSFGTLHGQLEKAAKGAGELAEGNKKLAEAGGKVQNGAGRLAQGIGKAHGASQQITDGLGTLRQGADQVAAGNRQLAAGVQRLDTAVGTAADTVVPLLREHAPEIRDGALLVARGADALAAAAGELPAQSGDALRRAEAAQADLKRYLAAHPEVPADVRQRLTDSAERVTAIARQVDAFVRAHTGDLKQLAANAQELKAAAQKIAKDAPTLADKVESARRNVDKLNAGAQKLASGSSQVSAGSGKLLDGSTQLTSGIGQLSGGAVTLETALGQISDGNAKAAQGGSELNGKLSEGAGQVPDYGSSERNTRADMMSSPVKLASTTENAVPNYGTGFAPFFVPLSLWVGGMIVYMLLRPVNPRAAAGTAPAWRVALAGWLPAAAVGVAQVGVVLAVLHWAPALGLNADRWPGLIAFLALASAAFLAVIQWVNVKFGPVGRVIALALLMLQLTSAAGTYPIETSPGFFRAIRPYLPMSWVVDGVRRLISGGDLTAVWQGTGVLAAFLAGALALTALAVRGNRVWTMKRLHPVLKL